MNGVIYEQTRLFLAFVTPLYWKHFASDGVFWAAGYTKPWIRASELCCLGPGVLEKVLEPFGITTREPMDGVPGDVFSCKIA